MRYYKSKSLKGLREKVKSIKYISKQRDSKYIGKKINGMKVIEVWGYAWSQKFIVKKGDMYIALSSTEIKPERWSKEEERKRIKDIVKKGELVEYKYVREKERIRLDGIGYIRIGRKARCFLEGKNGRRYEVKDFDGSKYKRVRTRIIKNLLV